jgi:NitT/TauT family transport system substrate-binding protein
MRQSWRRPAILVSVVTLIASLTAACGGGSDDKPSKSGLEKTTLKIAAIPLVDDAGLYIAVKHKFFEAEGLKVQIQLIQKSVQAMGSLTKGDIDIVAGANYVSSIQALDKGVFKPMVIGEGGMLEPKGRQVIVAPKSPIKQPKDLEGKTIAVNIKNNIQSLAVNTVLKANNVDVSKIKYVEVPFAQMPLALQKGQVDAADELEPYLTNSVKTIGARSIVDSSGEPVKDIPTSGFIATQQFAQKNPKTAAAFQRAILKAQQLASSDRKEVESVLPSYTTIKPDIASVITLPGYPTSINATRMQRLIDLMLSNKMITNRVDAKSILFTPPSK